jgi:hypothetical protein
MPDSRGTEDSRAAARLAGIASPAALTQTSASSLASGFVEDATWDILAAEILTSVRVELVGIAPQRLVTALRSKIEQQHTMNLVGPRIKYYTPTPELILANQSHGPQTRLVNRWHIGLMGLRNTVKALASLSAADSSSSDPDFHHLAFGLASVFIECAMLVYRDNSSDPHVYLLSELPGRRVVPTPPPSIISICTQGRGQIVGFLKEVMADAGPIRLREVNCGRVASATEDNTPQEAPVFEIQSLPPYGTSINPSQDICKPVSVVVVRCPSPQGLDVMLKRRSVFTDNDDFGKLSLLSSRLQETDIASTLATGVSPSAEDDNTALEDLWLAAGNPSPFLLRPESFVFAAQREISITCGLEINPERLVIRGFHFLERDDRGEQLGFAVFTLDLVRGADFDEVRYALERNPEGLQRVHVANLYDSELPLNRLLRSRREWLVKHCLS